MRVKLEHPVQFPSRLIVPSPARLSVTPWASEKRATDSRKEALSERGNGDGDGDDGGRNRGEKGGGRRVVAGRGAGRKPENVGA